MNSVSVAVLGATGAVGREMLKVLYERKFPVNHIKALTSEKSAGKALPFGNAFLIAEEADENAFQGMNIVLGATNAAIAQRMAPSIKAAGAVLIDNSSAFRMEENVPLIVPEINAKAVKSHCGIISNPNCSTIIALTAVASLHRLSPIETMTVSTYQAVSGAGSDGQTELENQTRAYAADKNLVSSVFPYQIAFNLIPQIGSDTGNGYTSEEMKLQNEGRKILRQPRLSVSCTCVRVPVMRSHSISIALTTRDEISVDTARSAIAHAPGCRLIDDLKNNLYPMPLDVSDQDKVFVGRIRKDLSHKNGLLLWCCGDQLRKGAATNAIQIAELIAH